MECGVIVDAITFSFDNNSVCLFQKLLIGFRRDDLDAPNWIVNEDRKRL